MAGRQPGGARGFGAVGDIGRRGFGAVGDIGRRMWGAEGNPFTQKQKAEVYDPNPQNFTMFGGQESTANEAQRMREGAFAAQDSASRQQALAQGQHELGQGAMTTAGGYRQQAAAAQGRQGPYMANTDAGRNAALSGQSSLNAFGRMTQGGPSGAQALANQQSAQAMRQNLALARSGRGTGSAAAMRAALGQNTIMQGDAANAAAQLKAQEYTAGQQRALSAFQGAAQAGQGIYGQDVGRAQAQLSADLQARGQNDALTLGYGQQGLGYEQTALGRTGMAQGFEDRGVAYGQHGLGYEQLAQGYGQMDMEGRMGYENLRGGQVLGATQTNAQLEAQRDTSIAGMAGGLAMAGGLLSDEEEKEDAKRAGALEALAPFFGEQGAQVMTTAADSKRRQQVQEAETDRSRATGQAAGAAANYSALATARNAPAYSYEYKDPSRPGAKPGTVVGPMAQDLQKTPVGNTLVSETADGTLAVDGGRAGLVSLSAVGEQQAEIDRLRQEVAALKADQTSDQAWANHYGSSDDELDRLYAQSEALKRNAGSDQAWQQWEGR